MSELHSAPNSQHPLSVDDVVPLWQMPIEQKEFAAWTQDLHPEKIAQSDAQFQSFSGVDSDGGGSSHGGQDDDIFEAAYRKGWEDGQAALAGEQTANEQATAKLADAIQHVNDLYSTGSFSLILTAIEDLFRRCSELAVPDPILLQAWATQLADKVDQDQKGASLSVNPDDLGLIDQNNCKLPITGDSQMLRGNIRLNHAGGWIEKGSEIVLDELRGLVDEFSNQAVVPNEK
ncbi:MAG: hypothetical protein ABJO01_14155 [Parasphingorhabdus sp.]|uniref:FliH/SctL family protein n=1 Tax=Parasphingorhabdus sp. TaxID=2709688 RepID=UPI0032980931